MKNKIFEQVKQQNSYIKNSTAEELKRAIAAIPTPQGVIEFLEGIGRKLNSGSSRHVFNIGPDKVLKVAFNKAGLIQNRTEIKNVSELYPFVPKIYDHHAKGYWLEMEKVSYPSNSDDLISVANLIFIIYDNDEITEKFINNFLRNSQELIFLAKRYNFFNSLKLRGNLNPQQERELDHLINDYNMDSNAEFYLLINKLFLEKLISQQDIMHLFKMSKKLKEKNITDIKSGNLGLNSDGNYVLLDFGFEESSLGHVYRDRRERSKNPYFNMEDYFKNTSDPDSTI